MALSLIQITKLNKPDRGDYTDRSLLYKCLGRIPGPDHTPTGESRVFVKGNDTSHPGKRSFGGNKKDPGKAHERGQTISLSFSLKAPGEFIWCLATLTQFQKKASQSDDLGLCHCCKLLHVVLLFPYDQTSVKYLL